MACNYKLMDYENYNGDFSQFYKEITTLFSKAFSKNIYLLGKRIKDNNRLWHIISDGEIEDERLINFERAKYINLLIGMLTKNTCLEDCRQFFYYEKNHQKPGKKSIRAYIYCPTYRYLIVLEKKDYIYGIITAFPIVTNHKHNKILEDFEIYKKKREPI